MKKIKAIFILFLLLFSFVQFVSAEEVQKKECIHIDAKIMLKYFEDKPYAIDNMFIFDIRPYPVAMKGKRMILTKLISRDIFNVKYMHTVKLWKGKDVFLVGANTQSTEEFCREMIKMNYGVDDIYVLKGGMDTWKGPVVGRFNDTECTGIGSDKLREIIDSGRKIYIIDWRTPEDFRKGHLPGAINGYGEVGVQGWIEDQMRGYFKFRPIYTELMTQDAVALFVETNHASSLHRCRTEKWVTGIENMLFLIGGMEKWDGPTEKGLL